MNICLSLISTSIKFLLLFVRQYGYKGEKDIHGFSHQRGYTPVDDMDNMEINL